MKILVVYGTRPEAIKLAPVVREFRRHARYDVRICVTAQHRQLVDDVNHVFGIVPDFDLDIMRPGQSLEETTAAVLQGLPGVFAHFRPELVIVQGDTTTALSASIAAFYHQIDVAHVEAGLRTHDVRAPFPEEMNRRLIASIAKYHFAPTERAREALAREHITDNVFVVGNTVVDAFMMGLEAVRAGDQAAYAAHFPFLDSGRPLVLVTGHRRESFGRPLEEICLALTDIASGCPDAQIVYPVHLNPNVQAPVRRLLTGVPNIHLIEPVSYRHMIWLIDRCVFALTDSGGVQEEAPSLGKPVLVMRETTERTEGVEAGVARLVGVERARIAATALQLLRDPSARDAMSATVNPYGDGAASSRIEAIIDHRGRRPA